MTISTLNDAFSLHQEGKIQEAIKAYTTIHGDQDTLAKTNELLGIAHAQLKKYTLALQYFQKALKLNPSHLSIQNNLATCYKKTGSTKKAMQMYQSILKHHPYQCVTLNNLASLHIQQKSLDTASYLLKKAISLQPKYADAYYNLGLSTQQSAFFKQSADLGHDLAAYQYALYLETQKTYAEALLYYKKSMTNLTHQALAHHGMARVLLATNSDEDALMHFIEAQKIDPYIPHLMDNIATYYHVKGMHANAVEYWLKALNNTEDTINIYYNIGVAYQYMNRHEDALSYFMQVLEQDPDHIKTHINIAAIALQNNQKQKAIDHYEKALILNPDNEEIQYILSALQKKNHPFNRSPKQYVENLFDQYAGHYNEHLTKMLKYQLPEKVELVLYEQLNPQKNHTVLDLGCGTGLMGRILSPFSNNIIGIDLSSNMLNEAKKTGYYAELYQKDCFEYLDQQNFDLILALELCPYIGDIYPLLQSIYQALLPGGLFIFSIESTTQDAYTLSEHARYQHNVHWVKQQILSLQFTIIEEEPVTLRTQNTQPVSGLLFVIKR